MPTPYSEVTTPPEQSPMVRTAISKAAGAMAKASAGSLGTTTAKNASDFQPDSTDQPVVEIVSLPVPAGSKLLIWATFQCNVEPAESGGADNTITIKVRVGGVAIDTWTQDLKLSGVSSVPANNFLSVHSESAAVAGPTTTVDFTMSSTTSLSDVTPAGTARLTVQIVGS